MLVVYMMNILSTISEQGMISKTGDLKVGDPEIEYMFGNITIGILLIMLGVNLCKIIYNTIFDSWKECRKKWQLSELKKKLLAQYDLY